MNNKKKIIIPITVITIIILLLASTLAYYRWSTLRNEESEIALVVSGSQDDLYARLNGNISMSTADLELLPTNNCLGTTALQKDVNITYKNSTGQLAKVEAQLDVIKFDLSDSSYTLTNNDLSHIHWAITTNSSSCTTDVVSTGTFQGITFTNGQISNMTNDSLYGNIYNLNNGNPMIKISVPANTNQEVTTSTYYVYIWIDEGYAHTNYGDVNDNPMSHFDLTLEWHGKIYQKAPSTNELYNVLKVAAEAGTYAREYTGEHQDDFNGTRSTEEIYHWYGQDEAGGTTIREDKFNVVFANMCWQMIRTTDTGGVKLLYNGDPTIATVNGKTTYDCGDTRPGRIGDIQSTTSLSGSYYYGTGYTTSVSGDTTTFTLTGATQVTVNSSNVSTTIANIAANYPYTCKGTSAATTCTNTEFYKVIGRSSNVTANVYSGTYRDSIGTSEYNTKSTSISDVGYKRNTRYDISSTSMATSVAMLATITLDSTNLTKYGNYYFDDNYTMSGNNHVLTNPVKGNTITNYPSSWLHKYFCASSSSSTCEAMYYVSGIDTSETNPVMYIATIASGKQHTYYNYLFGDTITSNGDGTFTLTGNVSEINRNDWYSNYSGVTTSKFVCLPGYYTKNGNIYTCGTASTSNNINEIGKVSTAGTITNFQYLPMYKYGNGIELDSGSTYRLKADNDNTAGTLQYVYNWTSTAETVPAVGGISTSGYKSLSNSHYTCFNLSGKCSNYYYINYTNYTYAIRVQLTGGKYVSTDLTDTNNILYEMLYAPNVNTTNSTIKGVVDKWYQNKLYTNYDTYIDDTVYCNERTITSFGGWNPNGGSTTSSNYDLRFKESTVYSDLSCTNTTDKFSISNSSAQLTYKVGLMSLSEMNLLNQNNARKSAYHFWLSSPYRYTDGAYVRLVPAAASLSSYGVSRTSGVRPAISLISGMEYSQGTGSMTDPYVVDASPVLGS